MKILINPTEVTLSGVDNGIGGRFIEALDGEGQLRAVISIGFTAHTISLSMRQHDKVYDLVIDKDSQTLMEQAIEQLLNQVNLTHRRHNEKRG